MPTSPRIEFTPSGNNEMGLAALYGQKPTGRGLRELGAPLHGTGTAHRSSLENLTEPARRTSMDRHPRARSESRLSNVPEGAMNGQLAQTGQPPPAAPRRNRRSSGFLSLLGYVFWPSEFGGTYINKKTKFYTKQRNAFLQSWESYYTKSIYTKILCILVMIYGIKKN